MLLGSAAGMINTTAYSFASQAFPHEIEKLVSLLEGVSGIGITFSPILGVFVFKAVGFSNTFFIKTKIL